MKLPSSCPVTFSSQNTSIPILSSFYNLLPLPMKKMEKAHKNWVQKLLTVLYQQKVNLDCESCPKSFITQVGMMKSSDIRELDEFSELAHGMSSLVSEAKRLHYYQVVLGGVNFDGYHVKLIRELLIFFKYWFQILIFLVKIFSFYLIRFYRSLLFFLTI